MSQVNPPMSDPDGNEAQTGGAVGLISAELRAKFPEHVSLFDDFAASIAEWEQRFKKASASARWEEEHLQATGVRSAHRQLAHLFASLAVHIVDLAEGLALLVNAERRHPAFPVARSIVEAAGVATYVRQEVSPRINKDKLAQVDEKLRQLTLGMDPGAEMGSSEHPVRVAQLINSIKTWIDESGTPEDGEPFGHSFGRFYSFVTDHSHPNASALSLSSTLPDTGPMSWDRHRGWDEFELEMVLVTANLAMWAAGRAFDLAFKASRDHRLVIDRRSG